MNRSTIQHFDPDPERLAIIRECMEDYGVADSDSEWTNNIFSKKAVVYGSGVIAKEGQIVRHNVAVDELALCKRLAKEVCTLMQGVDVGMGSESSDPFGEFFIVANIDDPVPEIIDEALIKSKFNGIIFPSVTMTVEPLEESGKWWSEVEADGSGEEEYLSRWRAMIAWFHAQPEFIDRAFVRIGEYGAIKELNQVSESLFMIETPGCVFPRMAIGLTKNGSLAGIFGFSVQT